jgi:hypothetical protein
MSFSPQSYRMKPGSAGKDRTSVRSSKPNYYLTSWSTVVEEAKAFFSRLSGNSRPVLTSQPAVTAMAAHETSGRYRARESFKRGEDVVSFGDELYKWRDEFNVSPAFIAMRNIESGEEVVSNPADLENSDLMIHWTLTHRAD